MQVLTELLVVAIISAMSTAAQRTSCPKMCRCFDQQVDCSEKSIRSIPSDIPEDTVSFTVAYNDISEVSSVSFPLLNKFLHNLLLNDNSIRIIQRKAFANLPGLQYLDLKGNRIRVIEPKTFEGCGRLTRLVLNHNLIDYVYSDSFYGLESLVELGLESNSIQTIDVEAFERTPKLEKLYLNNNRFLDLPASGPIFKSLSTHARSRQLQHNRAVT